MFRDVFGTQEGSNVTTRGSFAARLYLDVRMRLAIDLQAIIGEGDSIINVQLQLGKQLYQTCNRSFLLTKASNIHQLMASDKPRRSSTPKSPSTLSHG